MKTRKINDIIISDNFRRTVPKEHKMQECRDAWNMYHGQDRAIVVDKNNILIDGYIQYLILKEKGIDDAQIILSNKKKLKYKRYNMKNHSIPYYINNPTTYLYGVHRNNRTGEMSKEYVWRLSNFKTYEAFDCFPGDRMIVDTKYGIKTAIITKIETLDRCPVNHKVKKCLVL